MAQQVMLLFWDALHASVLMIETLTALLYPAVLVHEGEADESALLRGCREMLGVAPLSYVRLRDYPSSDLAGLEPRLPEQAEPFLITNWNGHLAEQTRQGQGLVWRHPFMVVGAPEASAADHEVTRSLVSLLFGRL